MTRRSLGPKDYPPDNYITPSFPALYWPPQSEVPERGLYTVGDITRFTLIWTVLIYAACHLGAAAIAIAMQLGKRNTNWRYMWMIPMVYILAAGVEALFAGSVVGLMLVHSVLLVVMYTDIVEELEPCTRRATFTSAAGFHSYWQSSTSWS